MATVESRIIYLKNRPRHIGRAHNISEFTKMWKPFTILTCASIILIAYNFYVGIYRNRKER